MPSPLETRKDLVQEAVESGASHVGRIATIVTGAVRDVAREIGSFATDLFELREAQRRALRDHEREVDLDADAGPVAEDPVGHGR
ncbi:hypothetical protein SK069_05585 [Patulibacter brassicae]|jgi:transposase-like protein|uniref:Uncharacterized protein n=1 Tax=Patulibacter brassicae TaxID=1705717 RepID=A0ABU4VJS0_9ACTN|nr:hypothetical protein [Patulibacter brassicae]MDX8151055.1 hypothetical protein [Patulibacter brassicae]